MKPRRGTKAECKGRDRKLGRRLKAKSARRELDRRVQDEARTQSAKVRETESRRRQRKFVRLRKKKKKQFRKKKRGRTPNPSQVVNHDRTLSSPSVGLKFRIPNPSRPVNHNRIHSSSSISGASCSKKNSWKTFTADRVCRKRRLRLGVRIPKLAESPNSIPASGASSMASVLFVSKSISMLSSPARSLKSGISGTSSYSSIHRPMSSRKVPGAGMWRRTFQSFNFSKDRSQAFAGKSRSLTRSAIPRRLVPPIAVILLNQTVFQSWDNTRIVLQKCQSLLPWAEDLLIVSRCVEFLAVVECLEFDRKGRRTSRLSALMSGRKRLICLGAVTK